MEMKLQLVFMYGIMQKNSKLYGRLNFMNKEELHRIIEEQ